MITPWLSIVVLQVRVVGRHPRLAGRVVVRLELDRRPPSRWIELFDAARADLGAQRPGEPVPHLQDGLVQLDAREESQDQDVADLLALLDATNAWFQRELRSNEPDEPEWQQLGANEARLESARLRTLKLSQQLAMRRSDTRRWHHPVAPGGNHDGRKHES